MNYLDVFTPGMNCVFSFSRGLMSVHNRDPYLYP